MHCRACGLAHSPLVRCEMVANRPSVSHVVANKVANKVANGHGQYADKAKRLAYMRALMQSRRAKAKTSRV